MGGKLGQEVERSEGRGVGGSRGLEVWRSGGLEVGRSGGLGRKGEGAHGRCVSGCSPFFLMDSSHFTNSLEDMGTRCQWKISVRLIPQFLYCSLRERRCWTIFWCGAAKWQSGPPDKARFRHRAQKIAHHRRATRRSKKSCITPSVPAILPQPHRFCLCRSSECCFGIKMGDKPVG